MTILPEGCLILGRYKIVELVTSAGQCFGYHAIDEKATKPWLRDVFVKQYHDLIPGTEESNVLRELYEALKTRLGEKSNYICLPLDLGEAGGSVVSIFPWIQGRTLKDKYQTGITEEECVRIAYALVNSVKEIHKKGIAHLDLKPSNLVLDENSKDGKLYIRLIDFDAATIDGICLRDSVKGTEHYYSPEHALPEQFGKVSEASDIFTMGIMLFELLLKQHPFGEARDYRSAIVAEDHRVPENGYHRDVIGKILQCLSAIPKDRPSAGSVLWTLNQHYSTSLEAAAGEERWTERRCYVQLAGVGNNSSFLRTYYETCDIDRNEFRGAKVELPSGLLFRLKIDKSGTSIVLPHDGVDVRLQGRRLQPSKHVKLSSAGTIRVGNNQEFLFRVAEY